MTIAKTDNQQMAVDLLYRQYGKLYLNKDESVQVIGTSVATLDRMRQTGEIKASKIKGSIKFSLTELAKFIDS